MKNYSEISEELKKQGLITFDNEEQFEYWLTHPNFFFGRKCPIELLDEEGGEQIIIDDLIRMDNGIFC